MSCDAVGTVAAIRAVAATVAEHRVELTHLDRDIGDGDHGENLAGGVVHGHQGSLHAGILFQHGVQDKS